MRVEVNALVDITHKLWTKEIQDNFESLLILSQLLDYNIIYKEQNGNLRISFVSNIKRINFYFFIKSYDEIDEIRITSSDKAGRTFEPYVFAAAIEFAKSLL